MFFNLKYHIVSIVAVFLALGLGILIGSAVPGNDALVRQQQQLTASMERQLSALRHRNESLQAAVGSLEMNNSIQRQFEEQVLPSLVSGRLAGRSIAIIVTAGQRVPGDLADILRSAGAAVQNITVLKGLEIEDPKGLAAKLSWPEADERAITSRIAREVAGAVLNGNTAVLDTLAAENILLAEGRYGRPVDEVVVLGGSRENELPKTEILDVPLIDALRAHQVNVYGVEESCAAYSYMREYQKKGITTVDNIDTAPGKMSLIYAISGHPGHYGIKSSARNLLPPVDRSVRANAR